MTRAFIREKNKVAQKNQEKATLCFRIYKIWQIFERFAVTFRRAQTLNWEECQPS